MNNVNVERIEKTLAGFQADPAKARKTNRVEGAWNLEEGAPQFSARLSYEGGEMVVEADQPTGQGGRRYAAWPHALLSLRPGLLLHRHLRHHRRHNGRRDQSAAGGCGESQ